MSKNQRVIVIGGSAGGISVVQTILSRLDGNIRVPLIVVLHVPDSLVINPSLVFPTKHLKVAEVRDKDPIECNSVYLAPGGYHLLVERDHSFSLSQDPPVFYCRPSIDVTFESVCGVFGNKAIGVLVTGANADGAAGLMSMSAQGCFTMVQHPDDSEAPVMPMSALELFTPNFVGSIVDIASKLVELCREDLNAKS